MSKTKRKAKESKPPATATMLVPLPVFEAHRCCEPVASRYALGGIKFETDAAGRPHAIATDGRQLMVMTWNPSEGTPLEAIVPAEAFAAALDSKTKLGHRVKERGEVSPTSVSVETDDRRKVTVTAQAIEGRYPKWRDVVPEVNGSSLSIMLDVRLVSNLLKVFRAVAEGDGRNGVVFTFTNGEGPIVMSIATDDVKACAVLMPLVGGGDDKGPTAPEWIPASTKPSAKAESTK